MDMVAFPSPGMSKDTPLCRGERNAPGLVERCDNECEIVLERLASRALADGLEDALRLALARLVGQGEQRDEIPDRPLPAARRLDLVGAIAEEVKGGAGRDIHAPGAEVICRHHADDHVLDVERRG